MKQLRQFWVLITLDLKQWLKMPWLIACALIPPIGMALLIIVLTLSVTRQPVALVIKSTGHHSDRMAELIRSDDDAYKLSETDEKRAGVMLQQQQIAAIITIPEDFELAVGHNTAALKLQLNNIDIDFADDIRRSVDRSVSQFDGLKTGKGIGDEASDFHNPDDKAETVHPETPKVSDDEESSTRATTAWMEEVPNAYHIGINEHDLRKTNVDYLHYQVIPVLILLVLNVGLVGAATLSSLDTIRGTMRTLITSPLSPATILLARLISSTLIALAALAVALSISILCHLISVPANHMTVLTALFTACALCASALGAVIGTIVKQPRNVAMASTITATYLFFMGGGFTTIAFLPTTLQKISAADPIRYAIDGLRQLLFYPSISSVRGDIAILMVTAFMVVAAGALLLRRFLQNALI